MGEKNINLSLQKACFNEDRSTLRFCFLVSALLTAAPLQSTFTLEEQSNRKLTASKDLETVPFQPSGVQGVEREEDLFFEYDSVTKLGYAPYHKPIKDRSKSLLPQKGETTPISQVLADHQRCQLIFENEEPFERERLEEIIAQESDEGEESGGWERNTKTGDWPYSIHGRLQMIFQKETLMGSGVMVGPRHVLTAGHNLYDHDRGGWATEVIFAPGRNEDTYPFGDARGRKLLTFKEWVDPVNRDKDAYDLGLVILDSPLGDYTGWSGLLSGPVILFEGREMSLTGYPGNKGQGRYQTTQMWTGRGEIESSMKRGEQFLYKMDTFGGQSGSALWDEKEVVTFGIHSKEEKGKDNLGVRLSEAKFKCILEEWLGAQNKAVPLTAPVGPDEASGLQDIDVNTWMQRAEAGELHAQYELGRRYYIAKKVKQAFLWLRKAAENEKGKTNILEYAEALTLLGQCYEKGEGVTQNTFQALLLYKKALDNNPNNTEAQCKLGSCYLEGRAGLKKERDAVKLFKEGAYKGGIAEAFYLLGRCYEEGRGVLKTPEEAYKLYKQAKERGYPLPFVPYLPRPWKRVTDTPFYDLPPRPDQFIESFQEGKDTSYLTSIWKAFHQTPSATISNTLTKVAIAGMGGVGKTYLTLAYGYEALENEAYNLIYWLNSETEEKLLEGYKKLIQAKMGLNIALKGNESLNELIDLVKYHVRSQDKWLLIYDNVPNPSFLSDKTPQIGAHILITSRYTQGWKNKVIRLDVFRPEESVNYLLTKIELEPTEYNREKALELATELGHLPLALSHASSCVALLKDSGYSLEDYLKEFREQPDAIFDESHRDPDNLDPDFSYKHLVAKTWTIAGKRISPLGRDLMVYFSYLDSESIVVNAFLKCAGSKSEFIKSLSDLNAFSLIKLSHLFASVHRLVQFVIRAEQEVARDEQEDPQNIKKSGPQIVEEICDLFIEKVEEAFKTDFHNRDSYEGEFEYLPHILRLLEHAKRLEITSQNVNLLEWAGKIFHYRGLNAMSFTASTIDARHKRVDENLKHLLKRGELLFGSFDNKGDLDTFERLLEIAKQSNASVQSAIGSFFHLGAWVPKSDKKAFKWYTKAAERGHAVAENNLGAMYASGCGVAKDDGKAFEWFTKAAKQGEAGAQHNLGVMYANGRGVDQDDVKAVEWYLKAAEQGYAGAQYKLGVLYRDGRGVAKDDGKAVEWYTKAAEQGHAAAQNNLGTLYRDGCGVAKDDGKAFEWLSKAAKQGEAGAQRNLGVMYANGRGVDQDDVKAVEWYLKAAEQGYAGAQCNLGVMYMDGRGVAKDDGKAFELFAKAGEQGDADAQHNLGVLYMGGRGVAKDDGKAVQWFTKAAEQGNADAQNNLGALYRDGRGVDQDDGKAVEWFIKAVEQGHALAQFNLGVMYLEGRGVAKDEGKAVEWYTKAAEQGQADAQLSLGAMYANGRGVAKDEGKAVEWYTKAAEQGQADAQLSLGAMYANGRGVAKDGGKAVEWYTKAAEQGQADAQLSLGAMYANGRGVAKDGGKAVEWYTKAAEQGHAGAQFNLGALYRDGRGVAKDEGKAVEWYTKAAEQGQADAQLSLGAMYANGHGVVKNESKAVEWFIKAAEQGHAGTQFNLGVMYLEGRGVAKDDGKAFELFAKAGEQGDADAQHNLGAMYANGRGVAKDDDKAVEWFIKAAEQGHAGTQFRLGFMYENGRGVAKDDDKAVEWYTKAAGQGLAAAQFRLGCMYESGRGVAKDDGKAVEWFIKAAGQGLAAAQYNLGAMYASGCGVAKDDGKVVEWFTKAAEQGDARAQLSLGFMYMDGQGIEQDYKEAFKWCEKAARQGDPTGQALLGTMYKEGWGVQQNTQEALQWLQKAADQGNEVGQYCLALLYRDGEGVAASDVQAIAWLREAANQDNEDAQYTLGWMYENGRGVAKDLEEAAKWYKASERGCPGYAVYSIGRMYEYGFNVEKNLDKALEWYRLAAGEKYARDMYHGPIKEKYNLILRPFKSFNSSGAPS
jgi:TPR repeat protein/V8-like Glu-specific endopeptidase